MNKLIIILSIIVPLAFLSYNLGYNSGKKQNNWETQKATLLNVKYLLTDCEQKNGTFDIHTNNNSNSSGYFYGFGNDEIKVVCNAPFPQSNKN